MRYLIVDIGSFITTVKDLIRPDPDLQHCLEPRIIDNYRVHFRDFNFKFFDDVSAVVTVLQ
jgi:hypothetical protein